MTKNFLSALAFAGAVIATNASAATLNVEVPSNAYITKGGYDIAWAGPCAAEGASCGQIDLSYQSQFGWEIMSLALFQQLAVTALDFVVDGGNVDYATGNNYDEVSGATLDAVYGPYLPNGDLAIAVPYFNPTYKHADWANGVEDLWDPISDASWAEALVVRVSNGVDAPAPAALGLFGLALRVIGLHQAAGLENVLMRNGCIEFFR